MFDKTAEAENWQSVISLEDGADEWSCDKQQLDVSERGMCFHSRCRFDLGTELAVTISFVHEAAWKLRTGGIVVGCEEIDEGCCRVTLLFLEPIASLPAHFPGSANSQPDPRADDHSRWSEMLN